jgi:hypothetical protein
MAARRRVDDEGKQGKQGQRPRFAGQTTRELQTQETETSNALLIGEDLADPTQEQLIAPRRAGQSTAEIDVDRAQEAAERHYAEAQEGIPPHQPSPGSNASRPEATPTLGTAPDSATDAPSPGAVVDEEWPPIIADYQADDIGATVQDAPGISLHDLLSRVDSDVTPAGRLTGQREYSSESFPDPWGETAQAEAVASTPTDALPTTQAEALPTAQDEALPTAQAEAVPAAQPTGRPARLAGANEAGPESAAEPEELDSDVAGLVTAGTIELPLSEAVVSSAAGTAAHEQVETSQPHNTDHVRVREETSSARVILIAATAALVLLGLAAVGLLMLTSSGRRSMGGAPASGSLLVRTNPAAGCTVFVDQKPSGLIAPGDSLLIEDLPARTYEVSVRCIGFVPYTKAVELEGGKVSLVKATLERE